MTADSIALQQLQHRLRELLPPEYQDSYELMAPVSMGSAALQFGTDGQVAWDRIWGSFCDLAMAGGPPHRGSLLEPADRAAIAANHGRHAEVGREICRGIAMVTGLRADPLPEDGWVRVDCESEPMAQWLMRAITMENVAVRVEGASIDLPAAPSYRLAREVKNVVTVVAKTAHYWTGHMSRSQQLRVADLFTQMELESPLLAPARSHAGNDPEPLTSEIGERLRALTGMTPAESRYRGWVGLHTTGVRAAVWMMRLMVTMNIVSRREDEVLFLPVDPGIDPLGARVVAATASVFRYARARGVA